MSVCSRLWTVHTVQSSRAVESRPPSLFAPRFAPFAGVRDPRRPLHPRAIWLSGIRDFPSCVKRPSRASHDPAWRLRAPECYSLARVWRALRLKLRLSGLSIQTSERRDRRSVRASHGMPPSTVAINLDCARHLLRIVCVQCSQLPAGVSGAAARRV